jgi:hypothetical protein
LRKVTEECVYVGCESQLSCVSGFCRAGDRADPCRVGTCKVQYACGPEALCVTRANVGQNCNNTRESTCMEGQYCFNDVCRGYES